MGKFNNDNYSHYCFPKDLIPRSIPIMIQEII